MTDAATKQAARAARLAAAVERVRNQESAMQQIAYDAGVLLIDLQRACRVAGVKPANVGSKWFYGRPEYKKPKMAKEV